MPTLRQLAVGVVAILKLATMLAMVVQAVERDLLAQ
jgi:hypothetical protein